MPLGAADLGLVRACAASGTYAAKLARDRVANLVLRVVQRLSQRRVDA